MSTHDHEDGEIVVDMDVTDGVVMYDKQNKHAWVESTCWLALDEAR